MECHLHDYVTCDSDLYLAERFPPLQGLKKPSGHVGSKKWRTASRAEGGLQTTASEKQEPSALQPQGAEFCQE